VGAERGEEGAEAAAAAAVVVAVSLENERSLRSKLCAAAKNVLIRTLNSTNGSPQNFSKPLRPHTPHHTTHHTTSHTSIKPDESITSHITHITQRRRLSSAAQQTKLSQAKRCCAVRPQRCAPTTRRRD
jgi:hypothetical protein